MEYEELSAQLIVADPETSVLRVESTIPGLQFNSRGGIKRVREPEEGVWEVLLHPGVHYMEIRASGYLLLKLDRMNFEPKGGRKIRVRAKARASISTDRNPELRLTWSDLPAGDVYVQIDSDPAQKIASARGA